MFVLDEADEMLGQGFKDKIHEIFQTLNENVQVMLLSATMPEDILEITTRFMREPKRILVKKEEITLEGIKQFYVDVEREVSKDTIIIHYLLLGIWNKDKINSSRDIEHQGSHYGCLWQSLMCCSKYTELAKLPWINETYQGVPSQIVLGPELVEVNYLLCKSILSSLMKKKFPVLI